MEPQQAQTLANIVRRIEACKAQHDLNQEKLARITRTQHALHNNLEANSMPTNLVTNLIAALEQRKASLHSTRDKLDAFEKGAEEIRQLNAIGFQAIGITSEEVQKLTSELHLSQDRLIWATTVDKLQQLRDGVDSIQRVQDRYGR